MTYLEEKNNRFIIVLIENFNLLRVRTWILGKIVFKRVHTEKDEKKNGQFGEGSLITLIKHT